MSFDLFTFSGWIRKWLFQDPSPEKSSFEEGSFIALFGKEYKIQHIQGISNRIVIQDDIFFIVKSKPSVCTKTLVFKFLKNTLMTKVQLKSHEYAAKIGVTISKIAVKKMRSRWGSCSSAGNLSYALHLVFAPEPMIDYVCAHEVAHLLHMNHGKDFWNCTQSLYPEYKYARKWFRENSKSLFACA